MILTTLLLAAMSSAATPPRLVAPMTVTEDDYPAVALRNEQTGTVAFAVDVGTDGVPGKCVVTQSSRFPALDDKTCQIALRRLRFSPALDRTGTAVPGNYGSHIRWKINVPPPLPFTAMLATTTLTIATNGTVADCQFRSEGSASSRISFRCNPFIASSIGFVLRTPLQQFTGLRVIERLSTGPESGKRATDTERPLYSVTARFTVDATGMVERCDVSAEAAVNGARFDICPSALSLRPEFFVPAPAGTTRAGTVSLEIYGVNRRPT